MWIAWFLFAHALRCKPPQKYDGNRKFCYVPARIPCRVGHVSNCRSQWDCYAHHPTKGALKCRDVAKYPKIRDKCTCVPHDRETVVPMTTPVHTGKCNSINETECKQWAASSSLKFRVKSSMKAPQGCFQRKRTKDVRYNSNPSNQRCTKKRKCICRRYSLVKENVTCEVKVGDAQFLKWARNATDCAQKCINTLRCVEFFLEKPWNHGGFFWGDVQRDETRPRLCYKIEPNSDNCRANGIDSLHELYSITTR